MFSLWKSTRLFMFIKQVDESYKSPGRFILLPSTKKVIGELDKSGQVDGLIRTGKLTGYPAYTSGLSTW